MTVTLHKDISILDAPQDVIVNPANSFLRHGGGLARIIADAAAPPINKRNTLPSSPAAAASKEWWNEQYNTPSIPTGDLYVGSPGALPHKAIIHAVGPIYGNGNYMEHDLLEILHERIFDECAAKGWSVAVPAISCGLFRFPVADAAQIAVSVAANGYPDADIHFYLMGDEHYTAYLTNLPTEAL